MVKKKINTRTKMQRTNNKVRAWLEANGYRDIKFFPHSRHSKDLHFQGQEFDGIASHENRVVLFQCKTNSKPTRKKVIEYNMLAAIFGIEALFFNAPDRKPLEINNLPAETFINISPQLFP